MSGIDRQANFTLTIEEALERFAAAGLSREGLSPASLSRGISFPGSPGEWPSQGAWTA